MVPKKRWYGVAFALILAVAMCPTVSRRALSHVALPPAGPTRAAPPPRPARVAPAPVGVAAVPDMDPPPAVRLLQVAALGLMADGAGLYLVHCPEAVVASNRHGYSFPGFRTAGSPDGNGSYFTVAQPEGAISVRSHDDGERVEAVLHWKPGADGSIECTQEEPVDRVVPVRVVDGEDRPVEHASIEVETVPSAETGPDGVARVTLHSDAPASISAISERGLSDVAWISPDDRPTLRIADGPGDGLAQVDARIADRYAEQHREIAAALATPGVTAEVAGVLHDWDDDVTRGESYLADRGDRSP